MVFVISMKCIGGMLKLVFIFYGYNYNLCFVYCNVYFCKQCDYVVKGGFFGYGVDCCIDLEYIVIVIYCGK